MADRTVGPPDYGVPDDAPVFVISVAATLAGMHPQTLRQYDRLGIVSPDRTPGRGRRYSAHDIEQLREVQRMSQEEGINLAGVKRILELENHVLALQNRVAELAAALEAARTEIERREAAVHASYKREIVPFTPSGSIVLYREERRNRP